MVKLAKVINLMWSISDLAGWFEISPGSWWMDLCGVQHHSQLLRGRLS